MYKLDIEIPFETKRHAEIVLNSVIQDEEPRSGSMIERFLTIHNFRLTFFFRKLSVDDNILKLNWTAQEARILRTSANSLLQELVKNYCNF